MYHCVDLDGDDLLLAGRYTSTSTNQAAFLNLSATTGTVSAGRTYPDPGSLSGFFTFRGISAVGSGNGDAWVVNGGAFGSGTHAYVKRIDAFGVSGCPSDPIDPSTGEELEFQEVSLTLSPLESLGWSLGEEAVPSESVNPCAPCYPNCSCYANCDGSTVPPILNAADFTCFLQAFAAGDPYANCDGSTTPPVLNVADFTCFNQMYAAGCP